jgi:hypothetical protein
MSDVQDATATERKQDRAIIALLSEPTVEAAARAADIAPATIWRWTQQADVRARLRDARRAVVEGAIGRLQQTATEAVETLRRNLTCGTPSVEVRAATAILEQAIKAVELFDVVERVEQLEARLAARAEGRHE